MEEPPKKISELQRRLEIKRALEAARKAAEVPLRADEIVHRAEAAQEAEVERPFVGEETALPQSVAVEGAAPAYTIRNEMLEGENAVEAVRNLEQGLQLQRFVEEAEEAEEEELNVERSEQVKTDCLQLYDPCTREQVPDIAALEKRVKDIKHNMLEVTEPKLLPPGLKTRLDLLLFMLNQPNKPSQDLLSYTIGGQSGQIFEAYWDIIISMGFIEKYPASDKFYMYNGNADGIRSMEDAKLIQDPFLYLRTRGVNMGASGASDITFVYKETKKRVEDDPCSYSVADKMVREKPKFVFCSSKYYKKDKKKTIDKYDIQNIYTAAKNLDVEYDYEILLLVNNPLAVKDKIKSAVRQYIAEEAAEVYGIDDLVYGLTRIYDYVHLKVPRGTPITPVLLNKVFHIEGTIKPILSLRLHQEISVSKITKSVRLFQENLSENNRFLVGILPRGGKTYIAGGIIDRLQPKRVVVLLGAKSETISQFVGDLFLHFQNFQEYTVINVVDEEDIAINPEGKYIFVMSVELFREEATSRRLLIDLREGETQADLFICDEAHLKQTTAKQANAIARSTLKVASVVREREEEEESTEDEDKKRYQQLDSQISKQTPIVYMTGTYIKPMTAFKIPDDNIVLWEYEDIQAGKKIASNEQYFIDNFGEDYLEAKRKLESYGENLEKIEALYKKFPELYLLSTQFTEGAKEVFLKDSEKGVGEKIGFPTITHLFQVKKLFNPTITPPSQWYSGFTNPNGMLRLINYLSPSRKQVEIEGVAPVPSVMNRIDKIAQRIGDRLAFFTSEFQVHSQLWFLPNMTGHPLLKRMTALAGIIFKNPWYRKNFEVLAVSSSVKWDSIPGAKDKNITIEVDGETGVFSFACPTSKKSLKECIVQKEIQARENKKGLIILAQNMLHLGISLACVDIVVLLDAGEKIDERIQKMYRALTESVNKKGGYIVDMNYFRSVVAIMNYQIQSKRVRGKEDVFVDSSSLKPIFNKVLNTYSIDTDQNVYEVDDNGALIDGEIQRQTLPELQRLFKIPSKGRGNSMSLLNAASAMNKNIAETVGEDYHRSLDELLGELEANRGTEERKLRSGEEGVERAEYNSNEENTPPRREPKIFTDDVEDEKDPRKQSQKKKEAWLDIFKTTLKLSAFGTGNKTLDNLKVSLDDPEFRDILYETLVKRGAVRPGKDEADEEYVKNDVIQIIKRELQKIIDTEGRSSSYMKMKEQVNSEDRKGSAYAEVLKYIIDHLAPKDKERHKYGEVFTPLTLVDEMLSKLPEEVWSNKEFKWLDPANGIGNFPIKAFVGQTEGEYKYPGLFEGLKKKIPDEKERCKHIIENMLYMIDINGKNNLIAKRLFEKLCPGAKANIEQIDKKNGFLTDKPLKFNEEVVDKFDIIMGNPPYQGGAIKAVGTKKTRSNRKEKGIDVGQNKNLWIPFVEQSINKYLNVNGYLLFIHPIGWFKTHGPYINIHNLILSNQIYYLSIFKDSQLKEEFGESANISSAYYLLQKTKPSKKTIVFDTKDRHENISLNIKTPIILSFNRIVSQILEKFTLLKDIQEEDRTLYQQSSMPVKSCNDRGEFKNISGINDKGDILIVKTNEKHKIYDIPKIYIDGTTRPKIFYDKKGEFGIIGQNQSYFIGEELNKIEEFFKTKLATFLISNIKFRMNFIEPRYLPDIRILDIKNINDKYLQTYLELNEEEIQEIEKYQVPIITNNLKNITCKEFNKKLKEEIPKEGGGYFNKTRKIHK
jgi:hypothetical protein